MKLKKIVVQLFVTALFMGTLAGCGQKKEAVKTETTGNVQTETKGSGDISTIEPCEITFWHAMSKQQEETLTSLTDQFNKENKDGIKVTLVNQGAYKDLSTKLTANAAADTLPDMAQAYNSWLIPYLDKVVKLDDYVANDYDDYDDIIEGYRKECSQFGFINAMPFNKSTYVYFYNKTLFDELGLKAPKTWKDIETIGETFKKEKDMYSFGTDDMAGLLEASLLQDGGSYISKDGAQFDNEIGQETVSYLLGLYEKGYGRLAGEDGYFSGPFSNQMVAAYIGSSTGVSYIDTSSGWELGVAPLPENKEKAANQAGTNLVMFSKDENKQMAVWEFMKFLTSKEATLKWAMETGYLPVRTSAYESDTYQDFMKKDPTASAAYSQSAHFFSSPTFDGSYDIQNAVNSKLEELILNKTDSKTGLKELVEAVNSKIK